MTANNINLEPGYWDGIWQQERDVTWRQYPGCFGRICWAIGHFNEVLELGCGTGVLARRLLGFGNAVTGLDISATAIAQLPPEITGIVATLPDIPLPDHSFDVIVATETLEHIEDDRGCIERAVQVLRPGGRLYVAVPNDCLGPEEEPEHLRKYTPEAIEALLSPYGQVFIETFVDEFVVTPGQIVAQPTILAALYT
ncbi:MAG: class I SAM-dependent methyltransferase [Stenomitos rutilans HA7619-LM2]|jgi:SAM-dependent methyltransferase|nr:class I SAM-dependent methyltransferase [Stenomitos rutilans HA7619-LM2]